MDPEIKIQRPGHEDVNKTDHRPDVVLKSPIDRPVSSDSTLDGGFFVVLTTRFILVYISLNKESRCEG